MNISNPDSRIRQHFNSNWTTPNLQKFPNVPEVPVTHFYKNMINTSEPVHSFTVKDDDEDPSQMWTILMHPWTCIGTIGVI